jgi:hypothetical protein
MTVNSRVIKTFLAWSPDATDVPLPNGLRIQILPTVEDLARARKHQYAAFVASEAILVVWEDEPLNLVTRAKHIEDQLMKLVWDPTKGEESEKTKDGMTVAAAEVDEESGEVKPQYRATNLQNTVLVALTLILVIAALGAGFRQVAVEVIVDHGYLRCAFLLLTPVQIFFTLVSRQSRGV